MPGRKARTALRVLNVRILRGGRKVHIKVRQGAAPDIAGAVHAVDGAQPVSGGVALLPQLIPEEVVILRGGEADPGLHGLLQRHLMMGEPGVMDRPGR